MHLSIYLFILSYPILSYLSYLSYVSTKQASTFHFQIHKFVITIQAQAATKCKIMHETPNPKLKTQYILPRGKIVDAGLWWGKGGRRAKKKLMGDGEEIRNEV